MIPPVNPHRRALAACALLALAGLAAPALARTKDKHKTKTSAAAKTKSKSGKSSHASQHPLSSDPERRKLEDARLTRECRGRPNAGACLGYAN